MATYEEITQRVIMLDNVKEFFMKNNINEIEGYDFVFNIVANISHFNRKSSYVYQKSLLPKEYAVIDIETTGFCKEDEIIQVSAIHINNNQELRHFNRLVKPNKKIPQNITNLTGISNTDLEKADNIYSVLKDFDDFLEDLPIIGHNIVSFDIPFINKFGLDLKTRIAVDTLHYSKTKSLDTDKHSLQVLKEYYSLEFQGHNALEDCKATYTIYELLKKDDITPRIGNKEYLPFFNGDKFVVTGTFSKISRSRIKDLIKLHGGKIMSTIGKSTDYFIEGIQTANNLVDGVHSSKQLKYMSLKEQGVKINKLDENQFLELIDQKESEWK